MKRYFYSGVTVLLLISLWGREGLADRNEDFPWEIFVPAFIGGSYFSFITETNPLIEDACSFLEERIGQGSTNPLQETIGFIKSRSSLDAEVSVDGVSLAVRAKNGLTRGIITDSPDRDEWVIEMASAVRAISIAQSIVEGMTNLVATRLALAEGSVKNNKALLLFPHQYKHGDVNDLASKLESMLVGAGLEVAPPVIGPIDVDTMKSVGNYGLVIIFTHGGALPPSKAKDKSTKLTVLSSGQLATEDNLKYVKSNVRDPDNQIVTATVSGEPQTRHYITYTSEFFKDLDLSGTLLIANACHSAEVTGTKGGDLASVISGEKGTLIGWSGLGFFDLQERFALKFVHCLSTPGNTANACLTEVKSDPELQLIGYLHFREAVVTPDNLHLAGDPNLTVIQEEPSPSISISSASCTVGERFPWGTIVYNVASISGTATGPVGTTVWNGQNLECSSWSDCIRQQGEPPSTNWSDQFTTGTWTPQSYSVWLDGISKTVTFACPTE